MSEEERMTRQKVLIREYAYNAEIQQTVLAL